jgi:hypothetical protein
MIRTQIQLTEEQVKMIKKLAASRHLSIAKLIRSAVDEILKSCIVIDLDERKKRALDIVGRFSSGENDISKKHDQYFAESLKK